MGRTVRLAVLVAAVTATACGGDSGPSWSGGEASASLEYTIRGASPTAALCTAVGASYVVLWAASADPGCEAGSEGCGEQRDAWIWECSSGTAQTGLDFRAGTVWLAWGLISDTAVRGRTVWQQRDLHAGNNGFTIDWTPGWAGPPDAAVVTNWTIDGAAADATSCAAAGASTVRLAFRLPGATAEDSRDFPCADGTGRTDNLFRGTETYELRWELRDDADGVLASHPGTGWHVHLMDSGDNTLPVDFTVAGPAPDAQIVASWTIHGAAADSGLCDDALATDVRLTWRETGTTDETSETWECADGTGVTGLVMRSGTSYDLAWDLLDAAGDPLTRIDWAATTPVPGDNAEAVDFLPGGALEVTLSWADALTPTGHGACDFPTDAVAEIGYRLEDATTSDVFDEVDIGVEPLACSETISWTNVPFGTYRLIVDGRAASPATATWHGECSDIVIDALVGAATDCLVDMVTE